ncbi:uncharacterized protein LOC130712645 [Lotus japonicus]|uniref:uncharacterized protein LOC130712645 n=1 Tax=Lotus japonicus TaxID=34305 RepID=UPI0025891F34|nr:uncharacterized protein LOC130712645 [Lotus japonicus]
MNLASAELLATFEKRRNIPFPPWVNLKGDRTPSTAGQGGKRALDEGALRPPPKKPQVLTSTSSSGRENTPATAAAPPGPKEIFKAAPLGGPPNVTPASSPTTRGNPVSESLPEGKVAPPLSCQSSVPTAISPPPPPLGHNLPSPLSSVNR